MENTIMQSHWLRKYYDFSCILYIVKCLERKKMDQIAPPCEKKYVDEIFRLVRRWQMDKIWKNSQKMLRIGFK